MNKDVCQLDRNGVNELVRQISYRSRKRSIGIPLWQQLAQDYNSQIGFRLPDHMNLDPILRARGFYYVRRVPVHIPTLKFFLGLTIPEKGLFSKGMNRLAQVVGEYPELVSTVGDFRIRRDRMVPVQEYLQGIRDGFAWEFALEAFKG